MKPHDVWKMDLVNVVIFAVVGFFLHIISNSIRIREFVLTRKINIQKDTDDLTGLKNKGALTREINSFLADPAGEKGTLLVLDIDGFKYINDTYGHDVGDEVISQLGAFLGTRFTSGETVGRFGGDEFIIFIKDTDDAGSAAETARDVLTGVSDRTSLPDKDKKVSACIGIALYRGEEKNYSEIFKKADIALYRAKASTDRVQIYGD
ncbi:MAG: GGDEF domain-containing protein [Clostridia bacterium]|nr:GGDEF domain-containing protein [Clostridia bacterium]